MVVISYPEAGNTFKNPVATIFHHWKISLLVESVSLRVIGNKPNFCHWSPAAPDRISTWASVPLRRNPSSVAMSRWLIVLTRFYGRFIIKMVLLVRIITYDGSPRASRQLVHWQYTPVKWCVPSPTTPSRSFLITTIFTGKNSWCYHRFFTDSLNYAGLHFRCILPAPPPPPPPPTPTPTPHPPTPHPPPTPTTPHPPPPTPTPYFALQILLCTLVASLMSLMASLVTTSRMQQCFNVLIDIYHEFL